jgi:hypothetical protein
MGIYIIFLLAGWIIDGTQIALVLLVFPHNFRIEISCDLYFCLRLALTNTTAIHESRSSQKGFIPEQVEKLNSSISFAELIGTEKTLLQNLSLWSGTSNKSYLSYFSRPLLLIVYPAVVWDILACK